MNQIGRLNKNKIEVEEELLAISAPINIPVTKQPNMKMRMTFLDIMY